MFDLIDAQFNSIDKMLNNLFIPSSLSGLFPSIPLFGEMKFPMNIATTKTGNQFIELAVCGKTKDDIEISWEPTSNGCYCLFIKVGNKNDMTENESGDKYEVRKLKKSIQDIQLLIDSGYDMERLYSKVKDGLLTIVIPKLKTKPIERKVVEIH